MRLAIALPTGALHEASLDLMKRAGVIRLDRAEMGRRLLLEEDGLRVIFVRPSDVPAYVDHGAADLGVVGKDVLWEQAGGHYELADLDFGGCKLVVAVSEDSSLKAPETWPPLIRVATKYPRSTAAFMEGLGQAVEIVRLNGSVELAPQVGLVDAIVDLTATGRTLRENRLRVVAEVAASTARLIANQASLKTRSEPIQEIVGKIRRAVEQR